MPAQVTKDPLFEWLFDRIVAQPGWVYGHTHAEAMSDARDIFCQLLRQARMTIGGDSFSAGKRKLALDCSSANMDNLHSQHVISDTAEPSAAALFHPGS